MNGNYGAWTAYPNVRQALHGDFAAMDDGAIEVIVERAYGAGVAAEDVEEFFGSIGQAFNRAGQAVGGVARQVAPAIGNALPGIAQGAMTGATIGGPWGALIGAVAGGAQSALSQSRDPTARSIGGVLGGATQLVGSLGRGGGAGGALAGLGSMLGGGGAAAAGAPGSAPMAPASGGAAPAQGGPANALLGMLTRPETLQALLSGAMGATGRSRVMVGQQAVPTSAILGLLGSLATRAAGEMAGEGDFDAAYLRGADGEWIVDPADPQQRFDALLAHIARTPPQWVAGMRDSDPESLAPVYSAAHAWGDRVLLESLMHEAMDETLESIDD